jgi:hypothetical protein
MLAEVLAAVAVVAIGLSALTSALPLAGAAVSEGAKLSTATFLAGARLEEVRAAAWSAAPPVDRLGVSGAPLSSPQSGGMTTFADEAALPDPYGGYSRQVRVLDCGLPPGCGGVTSGRLRHVTVTVAYRPVTVSGLAALDKTVFVATLVAQR